MNRIPRRTAVLLVLFLAAGSAQALPWGWSPAVDSNSAGIIATVWQWIGSWLAPASPEAAWSQIGIEIDPNGVDAGSDMDPHGGNAAQVDGDEGADMDPHG